LKKIFLLTIAISAIMSGARLSAESTELSVKKTDIYAVIKVYYGYRNSSPESGESETDLAYRLQSNSRFGLKAEIENVRVNVELGLMSPVYLRLAYATAVYGDLKITAGQDYTPYDWTASGDYVDDNNCLGFGASYDGRLPLIRLELYGAYLSLITPSRATPGITGSGASGAVKDTTVLFPKTAIGYDYISGLSVLGFGGVVNAVKINDPLCSADGKNIVSWFGYAHTNACLGSFILRGNFAYGQNSGNFGILNTTTGNPDTMALSAGFSSFSASSSAVPAGTKIKSTTCIEGYINPQYMITSALTIGGGVGYARAENDTYKSPDAQICYFADIKYNLSRYISIMPGFVYRDYMKDKDGNRQGSEYYAGTQVQISI